MSSNHQVLLDQVLEQARNSSASELSQSDYFELFVAEQVLKEYDLSYDELESGVVDGGNDGGVDSIYFFVNGDLILEDSDPVVPKKEVTMRLVLIQSKTTPGFKEHPIDALAGTVGDLFNFSEALTAYDKTYNSKLLSKIEKFRETYLSMATLFPKLSVEYFYATRGMFPSESAKTRSSHILEATTAHFPDCRATFEFLGATELLDRARRAPSTVSTLPISDGPILTEAGGVICLVKLVDYCAFISDGQGNLRKQLFESNVRDYQGRTEVNEGIRTTLEAQQPALEDFWWLNNGVTILCAKSSLTSKNLTIEDPQIVNGLQSSTEIFNYCNQEIGRGDGRSVLVRIVNPIDGASRDRIIKATNSQTKIPDASLRATDSVQRDIEDHFLAHGYFYDRRKNFYKNQGKPKDRVISIPLLAQSVMAIVRQEPDNSRARPSSLLKNDQTYATIFSANFPIDCYLNCAVVMKKVDDFLRACGEVPSSGERNNIHFHIAMYATCVTVGSSSVHPKQVAALDVSAMTESILTYALKSVITLFENVQYEFGMYPDQAAKSPQFVASLKRTLTDLYPKHLGALDRSTDTPVGN